SSRSWARLKTLQRRHRASNRFFEQNCVLRCRLRVAANECRLADCHLKRVRKVVNDLPPENRIGVAHDSASALVVPALRIWSAALKIRCALRSEIGSPD